MASPGEHERPLSQPSPPPKRQKVDNNESFSLSNSINNSSHSSIISYPFPESLPHSRAKVKSKEVLRLMIQAVDELGLSESAKKLREESMVCQESDDIFKFRCSILNGEWEFALASVSLLSPKSKLHHLILLWCIHRHIYLELVENEDITGAIQVLRKELQPLCHSISSYNESIDDQDYQKNIKILSSLLVFHDPFTLKERADWLGIDNGARSELLKRLHKYVSPSVMLPPGRLGTLLDQAIISQQDNCLHHHESEMYHHSLLDDHQCQNNRVPTMPLEITDNIEDEVWCLQFSISGKYLAAGGKDGSVYVWHTENNNDTMGKLYKKTMIRGGGIHNICWSNDDKTILCCSSRKVSVWSLESNIIIVLREPENRTASSNSIQSIILDGDNDTGDYICGGLGQYITKYSIGGGKELAQWKIPNVVDLDYNKSRNILVSVCQQQNITIIKLDNNTMESIEEISRISSVAISEDGKFVLVHLFSQVVHLWDIDTKKLVRQYYQKRSSQPVRIFLNAVFGGQYDSYIISGSIEGKIYLWERNGVLLEVLDAHKKPVNCIKWNKALKEEMMFASCGDDNKVIIWQSMTANS